MVDQNNAETKIDPRVLVAICTLNEAENIASMLTRLRAAFPTADLLVIDDDSPDGTARLASEMAMKDPAIRVIVRDERGLGGAIRKTIMVAIEGGYAFLLNLDADLSHDPDQLPSLLQRAQSEPLVDVVIGSRYVTGGSIVGWPLHRKWMSRIVNGFATLCLRLPVKDCSGSMRCYRVPALQQSEMSTLRSNGYAVLEEILVRLNRHDATMAEVPITFTDRQHGSSKLTLREAIRSIARMLSMAIKS